MKSIPLVAATMLATLSGCTTHLESGPALASDPASRRGIAYFLPYSQFDVDVTWTVTGCNEKEIELDVAIDAQALTAPDPKSLQVIDYEALAGFTKTSSVKVDFYDSGAIKSINASAEDKSGEIIGSVVSAIGKLAPLVAGVPMAAPAEGPTKADSTETQKVYLCSIAVKKSLEDLPGQLGDVAKLTRKLEIEEQALDELTERLADSKSGRNSKAFNTLTAQIQSAKDARAELEKAETKLAQTSKVLTFTTTVRMPETSDKSASDTQNVPARIWQKWLATDTSSTVIADKVTSSAITLQLSTTQGWEAGTDIDAMPVSAKAKREAGIRYRVAVPGELLACSGTKCDFPAGGGQASNLVAGPIPVRIINRATTFYLPFKSKGFASGALEAQFAEDGTMTSAGFDQKKAPGEGVAQAFDTVAGGIADIAKERKGRKLQAIKDETELAKAEADLAAARKALDKSPLDGAEKETAAIQTETKLLEAKAARASAELALKKAETELAKAEASGTSN